MSSTIKQQFLFFILFGVIAVGILVASIYHTTQSQLNKKMGILEPSPLAAGLHLKLAHIPSHTTYSLPYPGLLPNHPLYPLKMIRDRLHLMATPGPRQRLVLLLHYANKRMAAADQLVILGYVDPAVSTATKAENYLDQVLTLLTLAQPDSTLIDELKHSLLKHEEIIEKIIAAADDRQRSQPEFLYQQLGFYRDRLSGFTHQSFGIPRPETIKPEELQNVDDATRSGYPRPSI